MASKIKFDMPDFSLALKNATEKAIEEAGFAIVAEVALFPSPFTSAS